MCKMIISPGIFSLLQNFDFPGCKGGKRAKNGPKKTKNSVPLTPYLRNHTSYSCGFWYTCVK